MYCNSFHYTPADVDCRFCTACSRHRCAAPDGCVCADLADSEAVDTASLRVMANALLIARFDLDTLKITF